MIDLKWAEEEIKLAKEEAGGYGKECLDSAFKAYMKMFKEGHAGYSFGETTEILQRLLEKKPLTAIKDIPESWRKAYEHEDRVDYVCNRMPSLIKSVYSDGRVEYNDMSRGYCIDYDTGDADRLSVGRELLNQLYPIEMPYFPPLGYYKIYYKPRNSTDEFIYLIKPDGERVDLNGWTTLEDTVNG